MKTVDVTSHAIEDEILSEEGTSNEDNSSYELLEHDMRSLHQCTQTLQSLGNKLGTVKDSKSVRADVSRIKNKSLTLSKNIHSSLTELRNREHQDKKTKEREEYNRQRSIRKKLEEEYKSALNRLQKVFDDVKNLEKKHPIPVESVHSMSIHHENRNKGDSVDLQLLEHKQDEYDDLDDEFIFEEEEREMEQAERDLNDLVEVFDALADSVLEQEVKTEIIAENIETASKDVHAGTGHLQKAGRYATLAGVTIVGGLIGAAVGGPVGLVVGANVAVGTSLAVGTGVGVGLGLGALSGYGSKKLADKVNSVRKKLKSSENASTTDSADQITDTPSEKN